MKLIFFAFIMLSIHTPCIAKSDINLAFHMGLGANGHYEIGGTIENNSSETLPYSAVTYITIDKNCVPSGAKVASLGSIKANGSLEFRIPVEGILSSYRILSISAWNDMGVPIDVDDRTAEIIKNRDAEFMKSCKLKRNESQIASRHSP
ncbi:MAG: FxLYD domain-containing protein [Hafnia alvei]|uniref:FxLYD domain-containing protein n=1 Tax=Hafnia alvei TaxID=569 RepID=UPI0024A88696|nr:FxLYD domain-containing protein [Hafnia alvei]MDU7483975.1 FxLYD domain-containing protein [Hafnia alvei]MDU7757619.1 FxLYD domain-containing protein [Staphylococcus epidermidis]